MKYLGFILVLGILVAACGSQTGGQQADAAKGYLSLVGSVANREVWIDGYSRGLDTENDVNRFLLHEGVHRLEIRSANRVLLAEDINISGGQTVEVTVP